MNNTALYKGVREYGMNSIYHTMQAINTEKEYVFYATCLESLKHPSPVGGRFASAYTHSQNFPLPEHIDANDTVVRFFHIATVFTDVEVSRIDENLGVHALQRAVFPGVEVWQNTIGDLRDGRWGQCNTVELFHLL